VDRLTSGRRHVRAGSVSVTELITKQAARPEPPVSVPPLFQAPTDLPAEPVIEAGTAAGTGALAIPGSHRRPPSRGAQLAKLTSLGLATAMLCGAVGVASMIAHQRDEDARTAGRAAARITGEQALLPGELTRKLPGTRHGAAGAAEAAPKPAPRAEPTKATTTSTGSDQIEARPPARTGAEPRASASATTLPVVQLPTSDLELVRAFYKLLPSDPQEAFHLISPQLLHSTLGTFLDSWSLVRSVDVVDIRQQGDDILAIVRMRLVTGGRLQLEQLLTVADSPRRIVGVELLSAQRN
jgi:hypothetical protein